MSKKEKVNFVRDQQFESLEDELDSAMGSLDQQNERIAHLLEHELRGLPSEGTAMEQDRAEAAKQEEPAGAAPAEEQPQNA
jgi:hypothetical protein